MRWREFVVVALLVLVVALGGIFIGLRVSNPAARHLGWPVPGSVRVIHYESRRDYILFGLEPEFRVAFTATTQDLNVIVGKGSGVLSRNHAWVSERGGPGWFWPATRPTNGTLYMFHESDPARYLWIDETGTNAFYLDWGI